MKKLLFVLIFLASSNVWAEWTKVVDYDEEVVYIDLETVKKVGKTVKFWILYDFKKAKLVGDEANLSLKQFHEINCADDTHRHLFSIFTEGKMGGGKVNYSGEGKNKFVPIAPETIASANRKMFCK